MIRLTRWYPPLAADSTKLRVFTSSHVARRTMQGVNSIPCWHLIELVESSGVTPGARHAREGTGRLLHRKQARLLPNLNGPRFREREARWDPQPHQSEQLQSLFAHQRRSTTARAKHRQPTKFRRENPSRCSRRPPAPAKVAIGSPLSRSGPTHHRDRPPNQSQSSTNEVPLRSIARRSSADHSPNWPHIPVQSPNRSWALAQRIAGATPSRHSLSEVPASPRRHDRRQYGFHSRHLHQK